MNADERRRAERHVLNLSGRYRLSGSPLWWRDCRVVDLSTTGASVELHDITRSDAFGGTLTLEVGVTSDPDTVVRLHGDIRRRQPRDDGMRVGVEFVGVSSSERGVLERLVGLEHV